MAALIVGPGMDSLLCAGDDAAPPVAEESATPTVVAAAEHKMAHCESSGACARTHVQGANAYIDIQPYSGVLRAALSRIEAPRAGPLPASALIDSLERPPRA